MIERRYDIVKNAIVTTLEKSVIQSLFTLKHPQILPGDDTYLWTLIYRDGQKAGIMYGLANKELGFPEYIKIEIPVDHRDERWPQAVAATVRKALEESSEQPMVFECTVYEKRDGHCYSVAHPEL